MTPVLVYEEHHGEKGAVPLVFAGSLGSNLAMWDPQVIELSLDHRTIAYDTRGHGRSPVPAGPYGIDDLAIDLLGVLDRNRLERAHIVGLSLGGMTAMRMAGRFPDRIASLTLLCTSAELGPAQNWFDRAALVEAEGMDAIASSVVDRWLTPAYARANPAETLRLKRMVRETPRSGYAAACRAIATMNLHEELSRITASTLVIAGRDDAATPPEHLQRIAASIDASQYLELGPAAHLASWEQAQAVNEAIRHHVEASERGVSA